MRMRMRMRKVCVRVCVKIGSLHVAIRCVNFTQTDAYAAYAQPQTDSYTPAPGLGCPFLSRSTRGFITLSIQSTEMPRKPEKISPPVCGDSLEKLIELVRDNPSSVCCGPKIDVSAFAWRLHVRLLLPKSNHNLLLRHHLLPLHLQWSEVGTKLLALFL